MKLPSIFNISSRNPAPVAPQAEAGAKAFRAFGAAAQAQPEAAARGPKQPRAADSHVFQEAAGQRRKGGMFSRMGMFMTGSHPDHIRNRAESVGDAFARRVDRFEQGRTGGLGGPLFGMGFKNYDAARPPAGSAQATGNPFASAAQPGPAAPGNPFASAAGGNPYAGTPFANTPFATNPFASAGPASGAPAGRPAPPTGAAAFAAAADAGARQWNPIPVGSGAFQQFAQNIGNDFANRVNTFERAGGGAENPFAGMAETHSPGRSPAAPASAAARPAAAPPAPAPTDQQRIDSARADYRSTMGKLTADHAAQKENVDLDFARKISVSQGKIEQIGRNLDSGLRNLDAASARETKALTQKVAEMERQMKELANSMRPLQAQAFSAGTDSRKPAPMTTGVAQDRQSFTELSHQRNAVKEQLAAVRAQLEHLPAEMAALRADMMTEAENQIGANDAQISRDKALRSSLLEGLDKTFDAARKQQMDRIATTHGVAFRSA